MEESRQSMLGKWHVYPVSTVTDNDMVWRSGGPEMGLGKPGTQETIGQQGYQRKVWESGPLCVSLRNTVTECLTKAT